ncbi:MAG: hypothetical protein HQL87_06305 [Magnetococcales bacterium]|nr:hypothetical protein [Magnetococcales bacterium]
MTTTATYSPISTIAQSTSSSSSKSSSSSSSVGSESTDQMRMDFLKLLTTQLQYQDPLSPTSNTDFTSQLAQFSSLDNQGQTNNLLQQLLSAQGGGAMNQAVAYIGKQVVVPGNQTDVKSGAATVNFQMPITANATVDIYNQSGALVNETTLPNVQAGNQSAAISGISGTDGTYTFAVSYTGSDGSRQAATALMSGQVTGVINNGTSGVMLDLNGKQVALSSVYAVGSGTSSSGS